MRHAERSQALSGRAIQREHDPYARLAVIGVNREPAEETVPAPCPVLVDDQAQGGDRPPAVADLEEPLIVPGRMAAHAFDISDRQGKAEARVIEVTQFYRGRRRARDGGGAVWSRDVAQLGVQAGLDTVDSQT